MADYRPAEPAQAEFMDALVEAGHLIPSGVPGVMGRGPVFEEVRMGFDHMVDIQASPDSPEPIHFPPLLPREQLEDLGYLKDFPHLAGTIFSFEGNEAQAREQHDVACVHGDWSPFQAMTDLVLVPAACYPVYPAIARRGPVPVGGLVVDTGAALVFRHEPSGDPARLQMFHMHELVRIGEPDTVADWRDEWRDRAIDMLRQLDLDAEFDVASDPFFGRAGRMMAASQREQALKFEILVPIAGEEPTAVASFNLHQDHFSSVYGLRMEDGSQAWTACLGFGLERITLALLRRHGLDTKTWPHHVHTALWPA